jgi:hypothetical protein
VIYLNVIINNPWGIDKFNTLFCKHGKLLKYKAWEFECYRDRDMLVVFDMKFDRNCDHAGVRVGFGLFGFSICAQVYDTRHWNLITNEWEV